MDSAFSDTEYIHCVYDFFFVLVGLMPTVLTAKYGGLQRTLHDKLWYKFDLHSEAEVLNFQQFCNYFYRWYIPMWCLLALMLVTYVYVVVKLRREVYTVYIYYIARLSYVVPQ